MVFSRLAKYARKQKNLFFVCLVSQKWELTVVVPDVVRKANASHFCLLVSAFVSASMVVSSVFSLNEG